MAARPRWSTTASGRAAIRARNACSRGGACGSIGGLHVCRTAATIAASGAIGTGAHVANAGDGAVATGTTIARLLLGLRPDQLRQGRLTYELRRLRLHGLIERIPKTHRYRVTELGFRVALFFTRAYARLIRPGLAQLLDRRPTEDRRLRQPFEQLDRAIDRWAISAKLAS